MGRVSDLRKESLVKPRVESSSQIIHLTFKLNESDVAELEKKIEVIKRKRVLKKEPFIKRKTSQATPSKKLKRVVVEKVTEAKGEDVLNQYFLELRKYIEARKYYPKMALRLKQAGSVKICIEIDQHGNFHGIHIKEASPFTILNKAALALVEEVSKFKPLPATMGDKITLNIPLKYALGN